MKFCWELIEVYYFVQKMILLKCCATSFSTAGIAFVFFLRIRGLDCVRTSSRSLEHNCDAQTPFLSSSDKAYHVAFSFGVPLILDS